VVCGAGGGLPSVMLIEGRGRCAAHKAYNPLLGQKSLGAWRLVPGLGVEMGCGGRKAGGERGQPRKKGAT